VEFPKHEREKRKNIVWGFLSDTNGKKEEYSVEFPKHEWEKRKNIVWSFLRHEWEKRKNTVWNPKT
jgi:hypothetical protein